MSAESAFDNAPVGPPGRREVDHVADGNYNLRVAELSIFEKDGTHYYKVGFEVADGLLRGKYVEAFSSVTDRAQWLRTCLTIAANREADNLPRWAELYDDEAGRTGTIRKEVVGAIVEAKIETKHGKTKDFLNIYVNKLLKARPTNTREQGAQSEQQEQEQEQAPEAAPAGSYHHNVKGLGSSEGLTAAQVADLVAGHPGNHKVWQAGWPAWKPVDDVPELVPLVREARAKAAPPAPPEDQEDPPLPPADKTLPYSDDEDIPF